MINLEVYLRVLGSLGLGYGSILGALCSGFLGAGYRFKLCFLSFKVVLIGVCGLIFLVVAVLFGPKGLGFKVYIVRYTI